MSAAANLFLPLAEPTSLQRMVWEIGCLLFGVHSTPKLEWIKDNLPVELAVNDPKYGLHSILVIGVEKKDSLCLVNCSQERISWLELKNWLVTNPYVNAVDLSREKESFPPESMLNYSEKTLFLAVFSGDFYISFKICIDPVVSY